MFFGEERLPVVQEMILADTRRARRAALDRLLPFQQSDFEGIFKRRTAGDHPAARPTAARIPPSLDEAKNERLRDRIKALHEANPMLGTRGADSPAGPEIYEMQVRAIVCNVPRCNRTGAPGGDHAPARRLRGGTAAAS
jgi:pyruvate,orthophosphate dikinase